MIILLNSLSAFAAFLAAACWFRASVVKVGHETAVAERMKRARKAGEPESRAAVVLDGWDMSETFRQQSRWNAFGATAAGSAALIQACVLLLSANSGA